MKKMRKRVGETRFGDGEARAGAVGRFDETGLCRRHRHASEEELGALAELSQAPGLVDFAADVFAAEGDGGGGGALPEVFGGPVGEVSGARRNAAELGEALAEIGGVAEFDEERVFLRGELDDVEAAGLF